MYGYSYSYSYGKIGGAIDLSLYKFTTWQPTTNIDGTREIVNEGTANNIKLYSGSGTSFNGTNQSLDSFVIPPTATNMIYLKDNVKVYTTTLIDFSTIVPVGTYKDVYYFNRALTTAEQDKFTSQPEQFYIDALSDTSCVLNMPMCDTDTNVRDDANYSEGIVFEDSFVDNSNLWNFSNSEISSGRLNFTSTSTNRAWKTASIASGRYYKVEYTSSSDNVTAKKYSIANGFTDIPNNTVFHTEDGVNGNIYLYGANGDWVEEFALMEITSGIYPLINHTTDTNVNNLQYGTQNLKLPMDSLGKRDGTLSDYIVGDGVSTANIPSSTRTTDIELVVNPTSLDGNVLSGGASLPVSGLTLDVDNNITLTNQTITSEITLLDGFKGTLKSYKETEI